MRELNENEKKDNALQVDDLHWLENWYASMCNQEWEDYYGIKISSLDNPGWIVEIDLSETKFDNFVFNSIENDNGDNDWMFCKVENKKFIGVGDFNKLSIIINVFRMWIEEINIGEK